jgi:hypothetical protein
MFAHRLIPAIPASQSRDDGPDAVYLNPFAREIDEDERREAIDERRARNAWRRPQGNDPDVSEQDAADALADGIASGDLDPDGEPVAYDRYRSAV